MFLFLLSFATSKVYLDHSTERQFVQWMRTNNVYYTGEEYPLRLGLFISHLRYCQEFNRRKGLKFRLGANKFSCYTPSEYKSLLGVPSTIQKKRVPEPLQTGTDEPSPDSIDWREKGVVNGIRDQGQCAASYAFSAIATSEAAYAIKSGTLLEFSEQNLVDCAPASGCYGGWPEDTLEYVLRNQNGKFNSRIDYPYTAVFGACSYDYGKAIGKINEYRYIEMGNEIDLKAKVGNIGVASVCIAANNVIFMSYTGGIMDNDLCEGARVDHAINVVGYGTEDDVEYWIIRNNFGTNWGEEGYGRMIRNKNNQCRITDYAIVAIDSV